MDDYIALKPECTPNIKANFNFKNVGGGQKEKYFSLDTTKLTDKSFKYKDFFYERKKLSLSQTYAHKFFYQRNSKYILNSGRKTIKSALYKYRKDSDINIIEAINKKNRSINHKILTPNYKYIN